LENFGIG